ncbi:MAG: hypothetical protein HY508_13695 [Acidobacteria bacterium]|nr:hypothetical protein [Acidobacteriota bacterium]
MLFVRALLVWLVMMGVEFCHGALRTLFLAPLLGDFRARQVSVLTGSVLIVFVAYVFIHWIRAESAASQLAVGVLWLLLTVAFEASLGHYIFQLSWEAVLEDFNLLQGRLMPLGLVVLTLSPWIATRFRDRAEAKRLPVDRR